MIALCYIAKPATQHESFESIEAAAISIFVNTDDRREAKRQARELMRNCRWKPVGLRVCGRIWNEAVDGFNREAIERAEKGGIGAVIHISK